MADGRMWLKCNCGKEFLLAKRMDREYYTRGSNPNESEFRERFDKFLSDHYGCSTEEEYYDPDVFSLRYE